MRVSRSAGSPLTEGPVPPTLRLLPGASAPPGRTARRITFALALTAAAAFVAGYRPPRSLSGAPLSADSAYGEVIPPAELVTTALGQSGAVRVHFALPGQRVISPIEVLGDTTSLRYAWEQVGDSLPADSARPIAGDSLRVPDEPGFYQLALVRDGVRRVVEGLTLAVLVPFSRKKGPVLDGYRIGLYPAERRSRRRGVGAAPEHPEGFLKVLPEQADLPISAHFRLSDFLTRDGQQSWPRFAAVSPRLLDKVELVLERISQALGGENAHVEVEVHSGYRTPAYNRLVPAAARDSRHQYGDAVDLAIDANGDGRIDAKDARLVAAAVDSVEAEYPDLVGGMGLYTSRRYRHPYVHIDARGTRVRWRG